MVFLRESVSAASEPGATSQGTPAAPTPGKACKTKGQVLPGDFVCVKKNGKLVWAVRKATATAAPTPSPTSTTATGANSGSAGFTTALGFAPWSPTSSNALFTSGSQPVGSQISTSRAAVGSIFLCRMMSGDGGAQRKAGNVRQVTERCWHRRVVGRVHVTARVRR